MDLAENLLADIEYARIRATDAARRAGRLARLLDDTDAMQWLQYETDGYRETFAGQGLSPEAERAAIRSNRQAAPSDGTNPKRYWTQSLAGLEAAFEAAQTSLAAASGGASHSEYAVIVENSRRAERNELRSSIPEQKRLIEGIVGAVYGYAASAYQELRFGAAVETAFGIVRDEVDRAIVTLVPAALPKLSAALENAASNNPEHWANAASTCRRLLKATADALRPPGPPVEERAMDDPHYINRLVDWIVHQSESNTAASMITADLEYLGRRLDAALEAGHKGTHDEVTRFDASRFITGTYLTMAHRSSSSASPADAMGVP